MTAAKLLATAILIAAGTAGAQQALQSPAAAAQSESETEPPAQPTLDELLWVARPIVVFADTPTDPRYVLQLQMLEERMPELEDRGVVVLTDTDPEARGPLRQRLRPRGFSLVVIDTDGSVSRRRPAPTSARELIHLIDRMPSRRQETGSHRP